MQSPFPPLFAGLLCGFVASIGVGPVNLTVVEQGLKRGFRAALLAGFGAITAEAIYAGLALAGYARLLGNHPRMLVLLNFSAVAVVLFLGMRYLLIRPREEKLRRVAERMDARWHHPKAWILGFLVTITNLTLLLLWATMVTMLYAHQWVQPIFPSRIVCVGGVVTGGMVWYTLVATFVSRAHRVINIQQLTILQRICGVIFLVFAAFLLYRVCVP